MYNVRVKAIKGFITDTSFEQRINETIETLEKEGNTILQIIPTQVDTNVVWVMIKYEPTAMYGVEYNFENAEEKILDDGTKIFKIGGQPMTELPFFNDSKTGEFEYYPVITMSATE